jgi:VCBS repeat-containing protein
LCVVGETLCGASCGDSAALLINDDKAVWLTDNQVKNPPVGSGAAMPVAISATLGKVWTLIVMSDGVWKYVGREAVEAIARQKRGQQLIDTLRQSVTTTNADKLPDDFSLALLSS